MMFPNTRLQNTKTPTNSHMIGTSWNKHLGPSDKDLCIENRCCSTGTLAPWCLCGKLFPFATIMRGPNVVEVNGFTLALKSHEYPGSNPPT